MRNDPGPAFYFKSLPHTGHITEVFGIHSYLTHHVIAFAWSFEKAALITTHLNVLADQGRIDATNPASEDIAAIFREMGGASP